MGPRDLAENVARKMYDNDPFSQWLGIEIESVSPGECCCSMSIRKEMTNGFGVCHGGVTYSLADSAFAFASNTHGNISVSIDNSMSYPEPVREGDVLKAKAKEVHSSRRLGMYEVKVTNQNNVLVGMFRGTVYRTKKEHFPAEG